VVHKLTLVLTRGKGKKGEVPLWEGRGRTYNPETGEENKTDQLGKPGKTFKTGSQLLDPQKKKPAPTTPRVRRTKKRKKKKRPSSTACPRSDSLKARGQNETKGQTNPGQKTEQKKKKKFVPKLRKGAPTDKKKKP